VRDNENCGRQPCCGRRQPGGAGRGALVEPAALAALLSSAGHGYDLRRVISELTDGEIEVDTGGLYRVLRRMEDDGYVTSAWAASTRARRAELLPALVIAPWWRRSPEESSLGTNPR